MYKQSNVNKNVIKAISLGLSAMLAVQPVLTTPVFADDTEGFTEENSEGSTSVNPEESGAGEGQGNQGGQTDPATESTQSESETQIEVINPYASAQNALTTAGQEANDPAIKIEVENPFTGDNIILVNKPLTQDAAYNAGQALNYLDEEQYIDAEKKVVEAIGTETDVTGNGDVKDTSNVDANADAYMNTAEEKLGNVSEVLDGVLKEAEETLSDENIQNVTEDEANALVESLEKAQADAQAELTAADAELAAAQAELTVAENALKDAEGISEAAKTVAEENVKKARAKVDAAYNKVASVNSVVTTINSYVDRTKAVINKQQNQINVEESKEELDKSIEALENSVDNLKEGTEEFKNAANGFVNSVRELEDAVDALNGAISDERKAQDKIEELEAEYENAQKAYTDIENAYNDAIAKWNDMKKNQLKEGYTQEDLDAAEEVVNGLAGAMNTAEGLKDAADKALTDFTNSEYARVMKEQQEAYNKEGATEEDKAAAAKAMAEAVIKKELADKADVKFASADGTDGLGKSENGFFYYTVTAEDGTETTHRYTYKDENGVINIYEMMAETTYTATYNGEKYAVNASQDENGNNIQTITVGDKTVTILGSDDNKYFEGDAVTAGTIKETTGEVSTFKITVKFNISHQILNNIPHEVKSSDFNSDGVCEFTYGADQYRLTKNSDGTLGIQYAKKNFLGTITGWSETKIPTVSNITYKTIDVPAIGNNKLVQAEGSDNLYSAGGKTYEKKGDSYVERISVTVAADAIDENTNYIAGNGTGNSSSQYTKDLTYLTGEFNEKDSAYNTALDEYNAADALFKELAGYKPVREKYDETNLSVAVGVHVDLGLFGEHDLALANGDLSHLPVNFDDILDIVNIEGMTDEKAREALLESIDKFVKAESDYDRLTALAGVMSSLGDDSISVSDIVALFAAADPEYINTMIDEYVEENHKGDIFAELMAKLAKEAAKAQSDNNLVTDFQKEYASAWLDAFTKKIKVVDAGIDVIEATVGENALKGELGGVVGATINLAAASESEFELALDTAQKALDYAMAGFGFVSAQGGEFILALADTIVTSLDKFIDGINKETQEAEETMLKAQKAVYALESINAPGSAQLLAARTTLEEATNRYNNLCGERQKAIDKMAEAKEQQKKAQERADELEQRRIEAARPQGGPTGGGTGTTGTPAPAAAPAPVATVAMAPAAGVLGAMAPVTVETAGRAAGVLGARAAGRVAEADADETGSKKPETSDKADTKVDEKADDTVDKKNTASKNAITVINDEEVAKAAVGEEAERKMNWWWLLLIAAGIAGEETYRRNKKKKDEEIELKDAE